MKEPLIIDIECTTSNKGNPFDQTNKMVCFGIKNSYGIDIGYNLTPRFIRLLQQTINRAEFLVGFNIKFDLHWLRTIGIDISKVKVWDCQLGAFILENQSKPYPSLNDAAMTYGFEPKLDIVKTEYWDKGIDTDKIPEQILSDYLQQDLTLTERVFLEQRKQFAPNGKAWMKSTLFNLQCADLLVLQEMEWNGMVFNTEKARKRAKEIETEIDEITKTLMGYIGNVPCNLNSGDHISCILYGGTIVETVRIPVGYFKTGQKVGEVRYKKIYKEYELPRLTTPIEGTEVKNKEGYWLVNDTVLRKLKLSKEAKTVVELLGRYTTLDKLRGTYLLGWSKLIDKMNWEKDMLHGNLNQAVAVTGRLTSTKPNMQNPDPTTKTYCESRYV